MSYRFYLFPIGEPKDVAAAHAWLEAQEQAALAGPEPRGSAPAWHEELRAKLSARHPDLRPEAIAADIPWAPFARLADAGDGVELQLYSGSVHITVPFWYSGEQAEHVLLRVSDYLTTVSDITGFAVYDPQLDAVVHARTDLVRITKRYTGAATKLRQWAESTELRMQN